MEKRGQVTIFIIVGIIIVALAVLVFIFYPQIKSSFRTEAQNPSAYMEECMNEELTRVIETISLQGGSYEPEHYFLYDDDKIEYLCYQNEYYLTCVVQQPMLKSHVESEIKQNIRTNYDECYSAMIDSFEGRGYGVEERRNDFNIELLPKRVVLTSNSTVSLTKGEESQRYDSLSVVLNNNLYELTSIANSIIASEAAVGDAETTTYMNYYRDLKVEKYLQSEGTTIYILTDRNSGSKFQFASRSLAWPPGYGI